MIPGIEMDLSGTTYLVPPLALGDMEVHQDKISAVMAGGDTKQITVVLDVSLCAITRNYPDMTREAWGRVVDVSNFMELFNNVMDVSGARRKAADAEKAKASNP